MFAYGISEAWGGGFGVYPDGDAPKKLSAPAEQRHPWGGSAEGSPGDGGGGSTPLGVSEGDLPPPIPGSIPDSSSPGVWRLRRLEAEGDTCIFPSEGVGWGLPGGGSHPGGGSLPLDASWHEEWQRRLGDWWAISPYTDALQVCLSAFSLHLASRLEAVWARVSGGGASRIASQRQQPHSVDAACEWVGEVELGLPPFPELRRGGGSAAFGSRSRPYRGSYLRGGFCKEG